MTLIKKIKKEESKYEVVDLVTISKYTNNFGKDYTRNWSKGVLVIKKVKNNVPWTYLISDLNGKGTIGTLYKRELQKANQAELRLGKVIKRKGDKRYVKWKDYNNFFNSWIDRKTSLHKLVIFPNHFFVAKTK